MSIFIRQMWLKIPAWAGMAILSMAFSTQCRADALSGLAEAVNGAPTSTATAHSNTGSADTNSPACQALKAMEAYYKMSSSQNGSPASTQTLQASAQGGSPIQLLGNAAIKAYISLDESLEMGGSSTCILKDSQGKPQPINANNCDQITAQLQQDANTGIPNQLSSVPTQKNYTVNPCKEAQGNATATISGVQPLQSFQPSSMAIANGGPNSFAPPVIPGTTVQAPLISGTATGNSSTSSAVDPATQPPGGGTPSNNGSYGLMPITKGGSAQ